jgi:hypothetical protein
MAKTKISEYSATSADNTDISNINIAEGCSPANVNNAIRTLMAQIKDLQAGTSGDTIPLTAGGTGSTTAANARTALSAAKSGANSDITSITGLTTPLTVAQGGTGASTSATAAFALKGANADITSLTGLTTALSVAQGGTGSTALTANSVVLGNGTSALSANLIAPSTSGNVLTSDGTTWTSAVNNKLTRDTAQVTTSGTSINFTSIPSWVKRITVLFNGVSTNGSSTVQVRIGAGSIQATGYFSSAWQGGTGDTGAIYTTGFGIDATGASTFIRTGQLVITNISGDTWIGSGVIARIPGSSDAVWALGGNVTLSGVLDRLTITTANGTDTFDAGSINIMYE